MLAIRSLTRSTTRRHLVTSAQKRALNKQQLEGDAAKASTQGGGDTTKPAAVPPASASSGGGGGVMGLALLAGAAGAAYYNDMIPNEYLPAFARGSPSAQPAAEQVRSAALKQANTDGKATQAAERDEKPSPSSETKRQEPEPIEHPVDGNRVTSENISAFYSKVNDGKAKEELAKAQEEEAAAAARATPYNEGEAVTTEVSTSLPSSASAVQELRSQTQSEVSSTLRSAQADLRSDLDHTFLQDLDTLSPTQLRTRLVQLVAELSDRTKWEAVRIAEYTALKEKEVSQSYLEILQKQRLEYEDLLSKRIREAEDGITRQANEALRAKEEAVQNLLAGMREGREKEVADSVKMEVEKIRGDLELEYQNQLQNELGAMKQRHVGELNKYSESMAKMQSKLAELETSLKISRQYESGSKKVHAVSAAALALANKLENGESVEIEVAALKGATAGEEEGVIASAVGMIPSGVGSGKHVLSLGELQVSFDSSYKKGREAAMVPEGRSGLGGQLLGMLFAKLSVPPSPDTSSADETDPALVSDSILSVARRYVQNGDIEKAVETLDKLKGQTAYVMKDWKSKAMDRVATERALKVIKLECALLNKDLVS